jgi:hypothetical protein
MMPGLAVRRGNRTCIFPALRGMKRRLATGIMGLNTSRTLQPEKKKE